MQIVVSIYRLLSIIDDVYFFNMKQGKYISIEEENKEKVNITCQWKIGNSNYYIILWFILMLLPAAFSKELESLQLNSATSYVFFCMILFTIIAIITRFLKNWYYKSFINIAGDTIHIYHRPILNGIKSISIKAKDISQLYIQETGRNNFRLKVKLFNEKNIWLLPVNHIPLEELKVLEQYIEQHFQIEDVGVPGETDSKFDNIKKEARRIRFVFEPKIFNDLFITSLDDKIEFLSVDYFVNRITQFDWNDNNSDKQVMTQNSDSEEQLFYLIQNKGLLRVYSEETVNPLEIKALKFDHKSPSNTLQLGTDHYTLTSHKKGTVYYDKKNYTNHVEQWLYQNEQNQSYIRIFNRSSFLVFFKGRMLEESEFHGRLKLDELIGYPMQKLHSENPRDDELV